MLQVGRRTARTVNLSDRLPADFVPFLPPLERGRAILAVIVTSFEFSDDVECSNLEEVLSKSDSDNTNEIPVLAGCPRNTRTEADNDDGDQELPAHPHS
jgi:hypothetical protein